jgi:hypothetical protein
MSIRTHPDPKIKVHIVAVTNTSPKTLTRTPEVDHCRQNPPNAYNLVMSAKENRNVLQIKSFGTEHQMISQAGDVDESSRKSLVAIDKRSESTVFHPTDQQVQQRISFVIELLLSGWAESSITATFAEKYQCTRRSAQHYVQRAYAALNENVPKSIEDRRSLQYARLTQVFANSTTTRERLQALHQMSKILGLYEAHNLVSDELAESSQDRLADEQAYAAALKEMTTDDLRVLQQFNAKVADNMKSLQSA